MLVGYLKGSLRWSPLIIIYRIWTLTKFKQIGASNLDFVPLDKVFWELNFQYIPFSFITFYLLNNNLFVL